MSGLFSNFPKKRFELPDAYQKIRFEHYKKNRAGATPASFFSTKVERWLHKKVVEDCRDGQKKSTLEIGAGTLNHLLFENNQPYDIVEPIKALYEGSPLLVRVNTIYESILTIPDYKKYQRILSIANFEHILNLPAVVAKTCLLLDPQGTLRVALPNEGHFIWKLAYRLTTGLEFRIKYGLNYSLLMKYEHVNTADEIEMILHYFFDELSFSVFGVNKSLAFYRFYACSKPKVEAARQYLG